ncbi:MAG: MarR family winged helix-turn-helix transcriptional regulator [Spirochaetota bacterium]
MTTIYNPQGDTEDSSHSARRACASRGDDHRTSADRSLGRQISYIARCVRWIVEHELGRLGVGSGTHHLLRHIHLSPGITQKELSRRTQIDKGTAARGVAELESAGYVRREPDAGDRRARRLYLTCAGERLIPTVYASLRHVTDICAADLSRQELDELFTLLDRVEAAASAHIARAKQGQGEA